MKVEKVLEEVCTVTHLELQSILTPSPDTHPRHSKNASSWGTGLPALGWDGQMEEGCFGVESSPALRQIWSSTGDLTQNSV